MSKEVELTLRPFTPDDLDQVLSSWANSYYKGVSGKKYLSPDEFHSFHRPIRKRILSRPNVTIIVCCPSADPWLVVGWAMFEALSKDLEPHRTEKDKIILHYIYVKDAFRGQGVATKLVNMCCQNIPVLYTHETERARVILEFNKEKYSRFQNQPHLT